MLMGIRLQAKPSERQKQILSQWMGCARFVWNGKCDEDKYFSRFARKYHSIDTYAPVDQTYSQFKDDVISPWLSSCPSQTLRNSAVNWYKTYCRFMAGECGKPKRKKKTKGNSIHLTNELFRFETCADGVTRLFIGTKKNNIGYLPVKIHANYQEPKSIYIKKHNGKYWVAFCYEDKLDESALFDQNQHFSYLKGVTREYLDERTVGIDRGIVRPVQVGELAFDFTLEQKRKKITKEKALKRYQRRMARQQKGSRQRSKTKLQIAQCHSKIANIRKDFCHKATATIVCHQEHQIFILEDLKTKNMTAKPKAKQRSDGCLVLEARPPLGGR